MNSPGSDRLPRGPHQLTRAEVIASQRGRLSFAALEAMSELGYHRTTVTDIVRRAQVSRRTFYEIFHGKDDCLSAGFDLAVEMAESVLNAAISAAGRLGWQPLVRTSLVTYLDALAAEPRLAHALHVEALVAGTALIENRRRMHEIFANRMRAACRLAVEQGDIAEQPPEELFDVLIGGIDDRVRNCLLSTGAAALPQLAPTLYRATLALFGRPECGGYRSALDGW